MARESFEYYAQLGWRNSLNYLAALIGSGKNPDGSKRVDAVGDGDTPISILPQPAVVVEEANPTYQITFYTQPSGVTSATLNNNGTARRTTPHINISGVSYYFVTDAPSQTFCAQVQLGETCLQSIQNLAARINATRIAFNLNPNYTPFTATAESINAGAYVRLILTYAVQGVPKTNGNDIYIGLHGDVGGDEYEQVVMGIVASTVPAAHALNVNLRVDGKKIDVVEVTPEKHVQPEYASGQFQFTSNPANNSQIRLHNGSVFTFVTSAPTNVYHVQIGATKEDTVNNLGEVLQAPLFVGSIGVQPDTDGDLLNLTAIKAGSAANSISLGTQGNAALTLTRPMSAGVDAAEIPATYVLATRGAENEEIEVLPMARDLTNGRTSADIVNRYGRGCLLLFDFTVVGGDGNIANVELQAKIGDGYYTFWQTNIFNFNTNIAVQAIALYPGVAQGGYDDQIYNLVIPRIYRIKTTGLSGADVDFATYSVKVVHLL